MSERTCRRCGAGYTLVRPEKGRRLCDRCRAARATFFTCPGCGESREVKSATLDERRRPVRCWDCKQQRADDAHLAAIAARVSRVEPALGVDTITAAILAAAAGRPERKVLAAHLAAHDDALTSESADAPRVLVRLVVALHAAGATEARLPRCPRCRWPARLLAGARTHCEDRCAKDLRATACVRCGRHARVKGRDGDGGALCRACWDADPAHHETCTFCGRPRLVNARTADGAAVCTRCYTKHLQPERTCGRCAAPGKTVATVDGQPVCAGCYDRPRRTCGVCGRVKRVKIRATATSPDLCGSCHWGSVATCTRCDRLAEGWGVSRGEHVCLVCAARERIDAILTRDDGSIAESLAGLREVFLAAEQPRSVLLWARRSPGARLLRRVATGEVPLTHDALDALRQTVSLRHLRALLVATGALPERDPVLADLEVAVATTTDTLDHPDDARLVRAYARWHVVARARRRATNGLTASQASNARAAVTQAARFVTHLREHSHGLADATQADLDHWLAAGSRPYLRQFLTWAAERGHAPALDAPAPARETARRGVDAEARWATARRLLHGDDLDAADRVVGALVVLYAQPLTRIAALRLDDLHDLHGEIHVSFGRDRVHMPGPLGELLRELPWRRQTGPSGHAPGASQWLFPGRQAGRHQHADYLGTRLRAAGIPAGANRTAALIQLGATVPPAVLAQMLNLHPNTAVRWAKTTGGEWTNYAAQRARDTQPEPTR